MAPVLPGKPLLRVLAGETLDPPPVWLMRQAGRYLPEYRALRARTRSFLELCLNPVLATEVTLQPIQRFAMDGAIVFSDILVVPHGLGRLVSFREGDGPILMPLVDTREIDQLKFDGFRARVGPVGETVRRVRSELPETVTLIGFAGSPWTVASYMIEGGSSREFAHAKAWLYRDASGFGALIERLIEATVDYLSLQIEAGAEVIQLFESWAGVLAPPAFERWVIRPNAAVVEQLKARHPDVPVILFPRGAGANYRAIGKAIEVAGIGLDTTVPLAWARSNLQRRGAVQGNLEPHLLVVGGKSMAREVQRIRRALGGAPFIFNLGHGVLPSTPPEHVAELVRLVRA